MWFGKRCGLVGRNRYSEGRICEPRGRGNGVIQNGDRSGICFGGCVACDARELPNVHRGIEANDLEQGIIRGNSREQQATPLRREALLPPKKVRHSPRFWGCQTIRLHSPPSLPHARPHRFQADGRVRQSSRLCLPALNGPARFVALRCVATVSCVPFARCGSSRA
jgi:hypothetical protein